MKLVKGGRTVELPFFFKPVENVVCTEAAFQMPKKGVKRFWVFKICRIIKRLQH